MCGGASSAAAAAATRRTHAATAAHEAAPRRPRWCSGGWARCSSTKRCRCRPSSSAARRSRRCTPSSSEAPKETRRRLHLPLSPPISPISRLLGAEEDTAVTFERSSEQSPGEVQSRGETARDRGAPGRGAGSERSSGGAERVAWRNATGGHTVAASSEYRARALLEGLSAEITRDDPSLAAVAVGRGDHPRSPESLRA